MSQKISITMSDELYSRLEKVRDRFNISGICQTALEKDVRIEELALQKSDEASIIERLKLQKSKMELSSYQEGKELGIAWAVDMSYIQLRAFVEFKELYFFKDDNDYGEGEGLVKMLEASLPKEELLFTDQQHKVTLQDVLDGKIETCQSCWNTRKLFCGFVDGVISFYGRIKDKINDNEYQHTIREV